MRPPSKQLLVLLNRLHWAYWVLAVTSMIAAIALRLSHVGRLPRPLTLVVGLLGLLWLCRAAVQASAGYASRTSVDGKPALLPYQLRLRRWFFTSVTLTGLWFADAVAIWLWPSASAQFGATLVLYVAAALIAGEMVRLAGLARRARGTERFRELQIIIWLRANCRRAKPLRWIDRRMENVTPTAHTSSFVDRLLLGLLIIATLDAPAFAVATYNAIPSPGSGSSTSVSTKSIGTPPPRTGPPAGAPTTPAETTPHAPPPDPSYASECSGYPAPGTPTQGEPEPPEARAALFALWLGPAGTGATVAGCAQPARRVRLGTNARSAVWFTLGKCGTETRSIGIYSNGSAALLLQQAARFAARVARNGELLGASPRERVGNGDLYVVQTTSGTTVLVRSRQNAGPAGSTGGGLPCQRLATNNVRYMQVSPQLIPLWRSLMEELGWSWPELAAPTSSGTSSYVFRALDGKDVGHGRCESTGCVVWTPDGKTENQQPDSITLDELLLFAPQSG
jgi:hypothetical protein